MKTSFNTEMISKFDKAIEALESIAPNMKKGVENSVDIAKESGSPKYLASAEAMAVSVPVLADQTLPETIDCLKNLRTYYAKLEENL